MSFPLLMLKNRTQMYYNNDGLDCFTLRVRNDGDVRRVTSEGAA
jgi:hypothetical protein